MSFLAFRLNRSSWHSASRGYSDARLTRQPVSRMTPVSFVRVAPLKAVHQNDDPLQTAGKPDRKGLRIAETRTQVNSRRAEPLRT